MVSLRVSLLVLCFVSAVPAADVAGVGNFHQVNGFVYRGAQPTEEGFRNLARLGITTVIDLREAGGRSKQEEKTVVAAGMKYVNIPMKGMSAPTPQDMAKVLALLGNESAGPVFVHCRRGADRTGTVLAIYRITHDRWENGRALAEAKSLGMSWVERSMRSYILHYRPESAPVAAVAANVQ
jgi:tyrosine-protein phosphatase SIW14